MRVDSWDPNVLDEFRDVAYERMVKAANFVKRRAIGRCPVGTISRPMYRSGKYAGRKWTSRDRGRLKKSIRVKGFNEPRFKNVRVYAGNALTFYNHIVEFETPFMRPAFYGSMSAMQRIMGIE